MSHFRGTGFTHSQGKNDWEAAVPGGVHVRTMGDEQFHHGNAIPVERSAHQGTIAALVDVRSVFDHPLAPSPAAPGREAPKAHGTRRPT